jgi:hypothetical protein
MHMKVQEIDVLPSGADARAPATGAGAITGAGVVLTHDPKNLRVQKPFEPVAL